MALKRFRRDGDQMWWDRLVWLLDKRPEAVLGLLEDGQLKAVLDKDHDLAERAWAQAVGKGLSQRQAKDLAYREVVAPEQPEPVELQEVLKPSQRARLASLLRAFEKKHRDGIVRLAPIVQDAD